MFPAPIGMCPWQEAPIRAARRCKPRAFIGDWSWFANPVFGKNPPGPQERSVPLSAYPGAPGIALGRKLSCTPENDRLALRFKASESTATLAITSPFRPARVKAILDTKTLQQLSARVSASWCRALAPATAFGLITERCRCGYCGL